MHYQWHMKCLSCSMHYTIYTYDAKWQERHTSTCPECGQQATSWPLRKVESDLQISQVAFGTPKEKEETLEGYDYASWPPKALAQDKVENLLDFFDEPEEE